MAATVLVPASIDSTGVTEVSALVQQVIDDAPDGSTITPELPGAIYRCSTPLRIQGKKGMTLNGFTVIDE